MHVYSISNTVSLVQSSRSSTSKLPPCSLQAVQQCLVLAPIQSEPLAACITLSANDDASFVWIMEPPWSKPIRIV